MGIPGVRATEGDLGKASVGARVLDASLPSATHLVPAMPGLL